MGMQIHEARCNDETFGFDGLGGRTRLFSTHLCDASIFDPKITGVTWLAGTIDDRAVFDMQVEFFHGAPLA